MGKRLQTIVTIFRSAKSNDEVLFFIEKKIQAIISYCDHWWILCFWSSYFQSCRTLSCRVSDFYIRNFKYFLCNFLKIIAILMWKSYVNINILEAVSKRIFLEFSIIFEYIRSETLDYFVITMMKFYTFYKTLHDVSLEIVLFIKIF